MINILNFPFASIKINSSSKHFIDFLNSYFEFFLLEKPNTDNEWSVDHSIDSNLEKEIIVTVHEEIQILKVVTREIEGFEKDWNSLMYITRIIRLIAEYEANMQGYSYFHGACLSIKNVGFCISGDKHSGKTSMLINIVKNLDNVTFISNDKIALKTINGELNAYSFPVSAAVRKGTLDQFLGDFFVNKKLNYFKNITNIKNNNAEQDMRMFLLPRDFKEIFKCEIRYNTNIKFVVKPNYQKNSSFNIKILNEEEKKEFLKKQELDYITINPLEDNSFEYIPKNINYPSNLKVIEITYDEVNNLRSLETIQNIIDQYC